MGFPSSVEPGKEEIRAFGSVITRRASDGSALALLDASLADEGEAGQRPKTHPIAEAQINSMAINILIG
tara:strand:- start:14732 stop:14938 length:207 start_codon:yes stop_codon:yes gene_type:complete